jgi:hypothetical protein
VIVIVSLVCAAVAGLSAATVLQLLQPAIDGMFLGQPVRVAVEAQGRLQRGEADLVEAHGALQRVLGAGPHQVGVNQGLIAL